MWHGSIRWAFLMQRKPIYRPLIWTVERGFGPSICDPVQLPVSRKSFLGQMVKATGYLSAYGPFEGDNRLSKID